MPATSDDPRTTSPAQSIALERRSSIGVDDSITSGYPKPHNRPLPSNNQLLFHLPVGFDVASIVRDSPGQTNQPSGRNNALVTIDKSRLPDEDLIHQLLDHFIGYTAAAFPIFHIPTLRRWAHQVCFEDVAVDAEEACAVICELGGESPTHISSDRSVVLAVAATSLPGNNLSLEMRTWASSESHVDGYR
jgi:hypothetical protein